MELHNPSAPETHGVVLGQVLRYCRFTHTDLAIEGIQSITAFPGGDLRWPNGPWPGEKTPYFLAKTGHMARHGIWPSDRLCLRWAGGSNLAMALVRWRADWVRCA